jgi:hypothetical protein
VAFPLVLGAEFATAVGGEGAEEWAAVARVHVFSGKGSVYCRVEMNVEGPLMEVKLTCTPSCS